jgi:hypothetical protein
MPPEVLGDFFERQKEKLNAEDLLDSITIDISDGDVGSPTHPVAGKEASRHRHTCRPQRGK